MSLESTLPLKDLSFIQDEILSHYDLKILNIELIKFKDSKKQRAIYKIETPDLHYCLKKVYYSKFDLEFVLYLMNYLENKNMYLPKIIGTKEGNLYLNHENNLFFLMTWVEGRRCDYDRADDLMLISENLAKLHLCGKGFDFLPQTKDRYNSSNWLQDFSRKGAKLLKIRDELYHDYGFNLANNYYLAIFHKQQKMIHQSLSLLLEVDFKKIMMQSVVDNTFCHLDYVNKNLYIHEEKVYMIDFDRSKLDICVHDLAGLLRRVMRRSNTRWDFPTAQLIIDSYTNIRPLSEDELKVLLAYVIFPQKFFTETKRYLKDQNSGFFYSERFKKIEKQYENKDIFVSTFKNHYGMK